MYLRIVGCTVVCYLSTYVQQYVRDVPMYRSMYSIYLWTVGCTHVPMYSVVALLLAGIKFQRPCDYGAS
jgi:hypothetical protein